MTSAAAVRLEFAERELELAREIQQRLLPETFPQLAGFDCAAGSRPARLVGGDFYDVIPLDKDRVGLVMADVSGKGMPAALFMALTRSIVRASLDQAPSLAKGLTRANHLICSDSTSSIVPCRKRPIK